MRTSVQHLAAALALSCATQLCAGSALAQQPSASASAATAVAKASDKGADHFARGTAALADGRYDEAIGELEAYADRSASHPDASYNRALAYIARVRNGSERPGDLGRAAAGFEETLAMRSNDAEAAAALALIHGEVARRRARAGRRSVVARQTLDRVTVQLTSERNWGLAAIGAAFLLTLGLVLRTRKGGYRVAGRVIAPLGVVLLMLLLPLYSWARHLRTTTSPAVIVAREALMMDDEGNRMEGEPIPEAALIEVSTRDGKRTKVRYGSSVGWVAAESVRLLQIR